MFRNGSSPWGWACLSVMVGGLAVVYLLEWRQARAEKNQLSVQFERVIRHFEKQVELSSSSSLAQLRSLERGQEALRVELANRGNEITPSPPVPGEDSLVAEPQHEKEPESRSPALDELPPLPDGLDAETILETGKDVNALVEDLRLNPRLREPTRVEKSRIIAELARARAAREVYEAEVHAAVAEGMETLRERGDYVEYSKGEDFEVLDGVLSAGEEIENHGVRLFYLQPAEFPEIYKKRSARQEMADFAVRKVLSILAK